MTETVSFFGLGYPAPKIEKAFGSIIGDYSTEPLRGYHIKSLQCVLEVCHAATGMSGRCPSFDALYENVRV